MPQRLVRFAQARTFAGTDRPFIRSDGEAPKRHASLRAFLIDPCAVTNAWFASFVEDSGYVTQAERAGWSLVYITLLPRDAAPGPAVPSAPWWRRTAGASWRLPFGPGSDSADLPDHPVVHVSWYDAVAFARWAGGRLPTEVEWEHAARGHLAEPTFPWGDQEPDDEDFLPCNIWQGQFPFRNTGKDGWLGTCPVDAFAANSAGLWNLCGNVWEWCADQRTAVTGETGRLVKGGSYLCHASYRYRYRIAARSWSTAVSSTGHMGFRVIFDCA